MNNALEEIKKKIDIVDFISGFITLKKYGRNFKALCPFHQEKTPSLVISPDRQIWHCFGACQTGGDAISFLMKWNNLTFYEALKELAEKTGVALSKVDFEDKAWQKKERLLSLNHAVGEFYHYLLIAHQIGEKARAYLNLRGVNQKIINTFDLGYAPASWNSLFKYLIKKGFTSLEGVEAGVLIRSDKGTFYDRFRKRIIFPLFNPNGQIIGFSGRTLENGGGAKYVNTPETALYRKRETLFGIHKAKDSIKQKGVAIMVEGEFDMISCYKAGISHAVAVKGSAVTYDQLLLIKRYAQKIILCLDGDFSGQETTKKAIIDAEQLDFEINVVTLNPYKDPDEAITHNLSQFKKNIGNPLPLYDFIIDTSHRRHPRSDATSKKNIGDEVVPFLVTIKNPIVQSYYIKKVAQLLDVEPRSIESLMQKIKRQKILRKRIPARLAIKEKDRFDLMQKYILHRIFQEDNPSALLDAMQKIFHRGDFSILAYQKLLNELTIFLSQDNTFEIQRFIQKLPTQLLPTFDEIILFDMSIFDPEVDEKTITRTFYELKRLSLKKKISEEMRQENIVEDNIKTLMSGLSEVEKKLTVL